MVMEQLSIVVMLIYVWDIGISQKNRKERKKKVWEIATKFLFFCLHDEIMIFFFNFFFINVFVFEEIVATNFEK